MVEQKRKIPTIVALAILVFGVIGGIIFAESSLKFVNRSKDKNAPIDIRITNITSSLTSISWITDSATEGYINYAPTGTSIKDMSVAKDDRLSTYNNNKYFTHHITLRNLSPLTEYEFVINSGDEIFWFCLG